MPSINREAIAHALREILNDIPRIFEAAEPTRHAFMEIVETHHVPYTDNLRHPDLWIVYPCFTALIKKLYPSPSTAILDWGGLYGHVTALLTSLGYETVHNYLLNIPESYEIFQRTFRIETLYGRDPNRINVPDASYDIVVSSGVLEHVQEDGIGNETVILQDISRILKPGGTFWLWYLPSKYSPAEFFNRLTGRWHHAYLYGRRQIVTALQGAGFKVLFLSRHGFFPGALKRKLAPAISVPTLFKVDTVLANLPLLRLFAANFLVVARKRETSPAP